MSMMASMVWRVDGFIEDGMQGIPITLGIFISTDDAVDAIHNVAKEIDGEWPRFTFTVKHPKGHLLHGDLEIIPVVLNRLQIPKEFS